MIGLAVYINGKKLAVAGADDLSVLNAIVSAAGELGKSTARVHSRVTQNLWLSVSGLTRRLPGARDEHLQWIRMKRLRVGDKVTVQIVRTEQPDKHVNAIAAKGREEARKRMQKLMRGKTKAPKRQTGRR